MLEKTVINNKCLKGAILQKYQILSFKDKFKRQSIPKGSASLLTYMKANFDIGNGCPEVTIEDDYTMSVN